MPNTFTGQVGPSPSQLQPVTVNLFDPRLVRAHRERFRRDEIPELEYANSFYQLGGRWPSVGWILLDRADYNKFTTYGINYSLQIDDLNNSPLTFNNLAIVQARCATRGKASDPNAVYLVQITDSQGVLSTPWFQYPTSSQYNVRSPAYPEQYDSASLNAGLPWTWNTMCQDLWNQMGTFLMAYPGLPITPTGTPENFIFTGTSAWDALNEIMDLLGLTISTDLTQTTNPYTISVSGAADAKFAGLQTKFLGVLEDDREWIDTGDGRVPGKVVVYFHRRNQFYGTEETIRNDGFQWSSTPLYSVTVPGPAPFNQASGRAFLWDDFTVRFDTDGAPLAADVTTAGLIATERVTHYYNLIHRGTAGFLRQSYGGALPFVTGSQVDGVRWFQTFMHRGDNERCGWRTEIIGGYMWEEVTFPFTLVGLKGPI